MLPLLALACTHPPPPVSAAPPPAPAGSGVRSHSSANPRPRPEWVEGAEEPTFRLAFWAPNPWAQYVITWGWRSEVQDDILYWEEGPFPLAPESTEAVWTFRVPPDRELVGHQLAKVSMEFDGQGPDGTSGFVTILDGYVFYGEDGRLRFRNGHEGRLLEDRLSSDGAVIPNLVGVDAPSDWLATDRGGR